MPGCSGPRPRLLSHRRTFSVSQHRRLNAKDWAKPFRARLLEPGLVSYEDSDCGKVLLRKETIDRCIRSFIGRPLVVSRTRRGQYVHQNTSPGNMKEIGHGYVTDVYYNDSDGWWWCKGLADTDEAVAAIEKVGKCSTGYAVNKVGPPDPNGWHDIPYQEEILDFSGEHLAVVDNPRYEEATIMLNSKNPKTKMPSIIKMLKKIATGKPDGDAAAAAAAQAAAAEKSRLENAKAAGDGEAITPETTFTLPVEGGAEGETETVSLGELIESHRAVLNAKKNGMALDMDDEVMCNGKAYKMNALVEAFDKWTKVNASEEAKKEEEKKNNSKGSPEPKTAEQIAAEEDAARAAAAAAPKKENAKPDHFNVLLDASLRQPAAEPKQPLGTLQERLARGRQLYGSKAKA